MKLKYKRIVLMITTFTMLIGLVIFSTISPEGASGKDKQTEEIENDVADEAAIEGEETGGQTGVENQEQEIALEKCTDEKISQLIVDYFNASVACDMEKLETLVSDASILDKNELKIKYELVEAVKNIECYLVKGPSDGKYLVYVYSEIKFKDVETMAPGLSRLSVVSTEDGNYVIFFGADSEVEQFVEEADNSAKVQELVQKVSTKMEEALSSDPDLKALNERMTGGTQAEETE